MPANLTNPVPRKYPECYVIDRQKSAIAPYPANYPARSSDDGDDDPYSKHGNKSHRLSQEVFGAFGHFFEDVTNYYWQHDKPEAIHQKL
jgi:hypothetical protein